MRCEEFKTLYNKKKGEGKPEMQIYKEIRDVEESQIILRNQTKEIQRLQKKIEKLEEANGKLKNENLKLGLKTKPQKIVEYHDKPFPSEMKLRRVKLILKSSKNPMTMSEIRDIAYGLSLGEIRDCLMILYFKNEIKKTGDKFQVK